MSIQRFNVGRSTAGGARSLGGLFIASFTLALAACSGADAADDPLPETTDEDPPSTTIVPSRPADDARDDTPRATDEGGPNVTDLDGSTAPDPRGDADPSGDTDDRAAGMSTLPEGSPDVPATDRCAAVADWDPEWVQFEEEVLLLVNEFRSAPADCGVEGQFAAAPPLSMNPILRCSARLHSLDMFERNYFEHETPDGVDP